MIREFEGRSLSWPDKDTGAWYYLTRDWPSHEAKIRRHCRQFGTAVQAGGCVGLYPRLLAAMFRTVITFEPDDINFSYLVQNSVDNIFPLRTALGAGPGRGRVTRKHDTNVGMHMIALDPNGTVPVIALDQLALEECHLLMLDLEDGEGAALEGARQTIKRCKPVMFVEKGDNHQESLGKLGYKWVDTSWMDCIFRKV